MNQGYIPIYHAHEVGGEDVAVDQRFLAPRMWPAQPKKPWCKTKYEFVGKGSVTEIH